MEGRAMRRKQFIAAAAAAATLSLISPFVTRAADYTWLPTGGGTFDWQTATNWSPAGSPNANTDTANLSVGLTGSQVINLGGPITVAGMTIGSTASPVTTDVGPGTGGVLTFNSGAGTATLVSSGVAGVVNRISAPVELGSLLEFSGTRDFTFAGGLTPNGAARTFNNLSSNTVTISGPINLSEAGAAAARQLLINNGTGNYGNVVLNGNVADGGFALSTLVIGPNTTTVSPPYSTVTLAGNNTNTGTVSVFRVNLVLANDNAFGTGTVALGGSTGAITTALLSDNDARTIANQVRFNQFITMRGEHSMSFTGPFYQSANRAAFNFLHAGKTVTLRDVYPANSADNRIFIFDGPGEWVVSNSINDSFATGSANPGSIEKRGTGTVTVTGTNSTYHGSTRVRGGLLQFSTAAGYGNTTGMTVEAGGAVGVMTGATTTPGFLTLLTTGGGSGPPQDPTASHGAIALAGPDAAANIDFTSGTLANANTQDMGIGAVSTGLTFTGTITPANNTYKLGGGGMLTLPNNAQLTGANGVKIDNGGVVAISGSNDYTGVTRIGGNYINPSQELARNNTGTNLITNPFTVRVDSTLAISSIANGSANSAIGKSSNAASNLMLNGGTLRYTGAAASTDRLFTVQPNGATLDASGTGPVNFTNTGALTMADAPGRNVTLGLGAQVTELQLPDISDLSVGMTVTGPSIPDGTTIVALMAPSFGNIGQTGNNGPYQIIISAPNASPGGTSSVTFGNQNRTLNLTGTNAGVNTLTPQLTDSATGTLNVVKNGAGAWYLGGNNTYTGGTTVNSGTLGVTTTGNYGVGSVTVNGTAALALASGRPTAFALPTVVLSPTATIDVNDNDMVVASSNLSTSQVTQLIRTARNGGNWNQPGITSTTARNNPNHNTTLGVLTGSEYASVAGGTTVFNGTSFAPSDTLVKYTYYGDTDFNGKVNFDDYVRTDNGFNNHLSGWLNGDFDLNGQVNFDDYVLIDLAFNTQSGTLGRALSYLGGDRSAAGMGGDALQRVVQDYARFGDAYARSFIATVPEPGAICLIGAAASAAISLRRRRRS
jgi:fibronectin-binding autotransporter adhesin